MQTLTVTLTLTLTLALTITLTLTLTPNPNQAAFACESPRQWEPGGRARAACGLVRSQWGKAHPPQLPATPIGAAEPSHPSSLSPMESISGGSVGAKVGAAELMSSSAASAPVAPPPSRALAAQRRNVLAAQRLPPPGPPLSPPPPSPPPRVARGTAVRKIAASVCGTRSQQDPPARRTSYGSTAEYGFNQHPDFGNMEV